MTREQAIKLAKSSDFYHFNTAREQNRSWRPDFTNHSFDICDLSRFNFAGAILHGANLGAATLERKLSACTLFEARYNLLTMWPTGFKPFKYGAILEIGVGDPQGEDVENLQEGDSHQSVLLLDQICSRFQSVARQLLYRRENRPTLSVTDEYDVQDLFHSLLWLYFDDIRTEEWTPSYAGKSSRMDFLLKTEQIVVETKKTRPSLTAKELGSELIEDIARYEKHPNCTALVCFVYDPEGLVANPRGVESDLNRDQPIHVRVFVRPK